MKSSLPRRASTRTISDSASATSARPGSHISRHRSPIGSFSTPSSMARTKSASGAGMILVVDRGEAAADVEPVEHHAGLGDQLADLGKRRV